MTQDEIIKMAWDSGAYTHRLTMWGFSLENLERFAKLVTAKRTWVGLTDEEIKEFDTWHDSREEEVGWCNPSEIVAYIETKLKEKNT